MTVKFKCQCGRKLKTSDPDNFGTEAKCPACGQHVKVPLPQKEIGIWGLIAWIAAVTFGMKFIFWLVFSNQTARPSVKKNSHSPESYQNKYSGTTVESKQSIKAEIGPSINENTQAERFKEDPPRLTSDSAERLIEAALRFMNEAAELSSTYEREMSSLGVDGCLSLETLATQEGRRKSRLTVTQALEIANRTRKEVDALVSRWPRAVASLKLSESDKSVALSLIRQRDPSLNNANFDEALQTITQNAINDRAPRRDLFRAILSNGIRMIDLLDASEGHWDYQDGQFLFESNANAQRFNKIYEEMLNDAEKLEDIISSQ